MSSSSTRDDRLVDLTLATVGEGELEAQFQERLIQAAELLADTSRYKNAKAVSVVIQCQVELERDLETGFYRVSVPGVTLKEPKKRSVITGAYLRDGNFLVEEPVEQLSILRPRNAAAEHKE